MKKILITGGTTFVSRFAADYFVKKGYEVSVLNRGNKEQVPGVTLFKADRHHLNGLLNGCTFDAVLDITAYTSEDITDILDSGCRFQDYIFISSGAVYPETLERPFKESQPAGINTLWGSYSEGKFHAEELLMKRVPHAYILRPPYIYGPMQNIYREPFVFECALKNRPFYIPGDGSMPLQFFHVEDLCRFMEQLLLKHPADHIFNVGNEETVTISRFVSLCYQAAGRPLKPVYVKNHPSQRDYFCFADYAYELDVTRQHALLPVLKPLSEGLKESFDWYADHPGDVLRNHYMEFIDLNFSGASDAL